MHHFAYRRSVLSCESVGLDRIAEEFGTPIYVYSDATIRRHFRVLAEAFEGTRLLIAYAVKANPNLGVIATLAGMGAGADVVSGGELKRALAAGVPADRIVFSGVGKTREEIDFALRAGIRQFNVESEPELRRLSAAAIAAGRRAPMAFRVNPHIEAGGHAHISTGSAEHKFGVAWHEAAELYNLAGRLPGVDPCGVAVHIGSQISRIAPMREAFVKVVDLARTLNARGFSITRIDLGGGLAIPYAPEDEPDPPAAYARMVREVVKGLDVELILEPGRMIMGNAGVLVTRVEHVKERDGRTFVIVDAGMNDLLRPALYGAHHEILPVRAPEAGTAVKVVDVVGPICETTDRFARNRPLPPVAEGDLLAFMSAGAYGSSLSSNYNSRPTVAEALVRGDACALVRRRPTFEELTALESVPDWIDLG